MSKEDNSTIKGWIVTAIEQYLVCKILQKELPNPYQLIRQKYHAMCQSFELGIKAYLLLRGHSIKEVKAIGHDLIALADIARTQHGLLIPPEVYKIIELINPEYKSKRLLYFEKELTLPANLDPFDTITDLIISKAAFEDNYPHMASTSINHLKDVIGHRTTSKRTNRPNTTKK